MGKDEQTGRSSGGRGTITSVKKDLIRELNENLYMVLSEFEKLTHTRVEDIVVNRKDDGSLFIGTVIRWE
jgi:hypothetical protein